MYSNFSKIFTVGKQILPWRLYLNMRIYVRGPLSLISHKLYESNSNDCFNKHILYIQAVSVCVCT